MCEFCVQHGDGKKWYLEASNYVADLTHDLERREYMLDFVQTFDDRMARNVKLLDAVKVSPRPVRSVFRAIAGPRQVRDHFGQPVPIEECERVFDIATSITQLPCVCRHFAGTPERGYCLAVTVNPVDDILAEAFSDYADGPDTPTLQRLTKAEAMALLRRCEDEGLMHSVWTFKTPMIAAICNCDLASGCMAMRTTLHWEHKTMWKGEYVAEADAEACTGCRRCVEHCPFSAISIDAGTRRAFVDPHACYGCGVCRAACTADALALTPRSGHPVASGDW